MTSHFEVEVWGRTGGNEITDFSTDGAFIRMGGVFRQITAGSQGNDHYTFATGAAHLKEGDKVDLVLRFPTQKGVMLLKAEIRRIVDEGVGVAFTDLTPERAKIIKGCFDAYEYEKSRAREQSVKMKTRVEPEVGERIWKKVTRRVKEYVKALKG
ncbi:MAG: PilZ domain-containing protein [Deltaproteobacteria bacterium]|nr:PilZ domain-containing protein [Deltaproteobacteria bacterium]